MNRSNASEEWNEIASADLALVADHAIDAIADRVIDWPSNLIDLNAILKSCRFAPGMLTIRIPDPAAIDELDLAIYDVQATISIK